MVRSSQRVRRAAFALSIAGCEFADEGIPEGKVAVVGDAVFGPEDLAAVGSQLGAYAQLRFSGAEGQVALLDALVSAELLAAEARDAGLGDDPRIAFALTEEIATVHRSAELERRVPVADVAADEAALRAHYDANIDAFMEPERRSAQGVLFDKAAAAEDALAQLEAGTAKLADFGAVFATPLQARDDAEFPAFHPFLFGGGIQTGDFLKAPVFVGESLMVARVQTVQTAQARPFADEEVQEQLVHAVRAPRLQAAEQIALRELEERYPVVGE